MSEARLQLAQADRFEIKLDDDVPTGSDTDSTQGYYDHILEQYIERIPPDTTRFGLADPTVIATWLVILTLFFYFFARFFNRSHRKEGELYGVTHFGGGILERNGKLSKFSIIVWIGVTAWALYYVVKHALIGQVY